MHGIIRHAIKKDLLFFGIPALVVFFTGLVVSGRDGYDGLTTTLWRLATGSRQLSELSAANVLGLALFVVGLTIALVAVFTLKRSYSSSLVIRENHRLVTHGLYRYVRHPVYFGVLIVIMGVPVYAQSVLGALVLAALIPLALIRIRMEEGLLIEQFGDEYRTYRARVKKLIPFLY